MISQYDVWVADLSPQNGTESEKKRPVLVIQTNLLNKTLHLSTLICPITTNVVKNATILRVNLKKGYANLNDECDIMIDQIRSIDNNRLIKRVGKIPKNSITQVKENILIIFDLE
jgi:mRNA interferase MazF